MKLALIGDLHLDERSPRFDHCLEVLDWTIKDALEVHDVDGFVFLGDLCEGRPSPKVFSALAQRFTVIDEAGSWSAVLEGNHEDYETGMMLRWLELRRMAWDQIQTIHDEASILLIPYPRRGRPPFDGLADSGTIVGSMSAAVVRIADAVSAELEALSDVDAGLPLIVCGHWTVAGMRTRDAEFEAHQGTEVVVPPELLRGAALVAVGHIHKAQDVSADPPIIGVGSLIRHSFAEADDEKSYTLVTVTGRQVAWERIPVPARKMFVSTLTWNDELGQRADVVAGELRGLEVKITVEIPEDRLTTFDASVFDKIRAAAAHFVLEKITVSSERTRAPEIAKASTVSDQVQTWLDATEQSLEPKRLERVLTKVDEVTR